MISIDAFLNLLCIIEINRMKNYIVILSFLHPYSFHFDFLQIKGNRWLQGWEIKSYQKMFSHAQIGPQGAEKQQSKVNVVGGGGNHYTYYY